MVRSSLPDTMQYVKIIVNGFLGYVQALENNCELLYFHTEFYSPEHEGGVRYNDPLINILWQLEPIDISIKDQNYPLLSNQFEGVIL